MTSLFENPLRCIRADERALRHAYVEYRSRNNPFDEMRKRGLLTSRDVARRLRNRNRFRFRRKVFGTRAEINDRLSACDLKRAGGNLGERASIVARVRRDEFTDIPCVMQNDFSSTYTLDSGSTRSVST